LPELTIGQPEEVQSYLDFISREFPIVAYSPHIGQDSFHRSPARSRIITSGNQWGKTTAGLAEAIAHCEMYRPWLTPDDPGYLVRNLDGVPFQELRRHGPIRGRVMVEDFKTSLEETIIPKLTELLPKDYVQFKIDNQGYPTTWIFPNGNKVQCLCYTSNPRKFESATGHWAYADEPYPHWAFIATMRGLMKNRGRFWSAMTPLVEPWIFYEQWLQADKIWERGEVVEDRESRNQRIHFICGDIEDNLIENGGGLTQEAIDDYLADIKDPEEKALRKSGRFPQMKKRLFSKTGWKDETPWVIDPFIVRPENRALYMGIDPHPEKPTCVEWMWVDETGQKYIVNELWDEDLQRIEDVCAEVDRFEQAFGCRARVRRMDAKMAQQKSQTSGLTVIDEYATHGIVCTPSDITLATRILKLKSLFSRDRISGTPNCQVFKHCARLREELQNARWESWTGRTKDDKAPKEKPDDRWKDALDCVGFIESARPNGLSFTLGGRKKRRPPQDRGDGGHTGY
jgi:hypothetical protein